MSARIVGHRGAALVEPENTLASFRRAVADGADLLECDVHLSADGHLVVMHDKTIDRTAAEDSPRRTGAIADLTRADLDEVRLAGGGAVPALDAVLDIATEAGVPIYVEVKAVAAAGRTAQLLVDRGLARGSDDPDTAPAWIISFSQEALRIAHAAAPDLPLAAVTKTPDHCFWDFAQEVEARAVSLPIRTLTPHDVNLVRELGLRLNVWTLNEADLLFRATELGADTITTDDPAWARRVLTGASV